MAIYYFYGVLALALYPFRKLSPKKLLIPLLILLAFGIYRESVPIIAKQALIRKCKQAERLAEQHGSLDATSKADLEKWQSLKKQNGGSSLTTAVREETSVRSGSDARSLVSWTTESSVWWESTFLYNNWWDVSIMFFLGMAMFRSGFLSGNWSTFVYIIIAAGGLLMGTGYKYFELKAMYNAGFDSLRLTEEGLSIELNQIRRILQVCGYVSLLILLYRLKPFRWFLNLFAPAGQTALTNYLFQSIIAAMLFYGLGKFGSFERYELLEIAIVIIVIQLIVSRLWLHYFKFGPFEWLWRRLVYQSVQQFKNSKV